MRARAQNRAVGASGYWPIKGNVSMWDVHPRLRYLAALLHVSLVVSV